MYTTSESSHTPNAHNIVLQGPVIVHILKPIDADTFEGDAQQVFLRYVTSQKSSRIEVSFSRFMYC